MVPSWRMRSAGVKGWWTPAGCADGLSMAQLGMVSGPRFLILVFAAGYKRAMLGIGFRRGSVGE